jgi:hypothetical protein
MRVREDPIRWGRISHVAYCHVVRPDRPPTSTGGDSNSRDFCVTAGTFSSQHLSDLMSGWRSGPANALANALAEKLGFTFDQPAAFSVIDLGGLLGRVRFPQIG